MIHRLRKKIHKDIQLLQKCKILPFSVFKINFHLVQLIF